MPAPLSIQVDTREKPKEYARIGKQFDQLGVKHFRSKLYVGDYQSLDNGRLAIDRKKGLLELASNVCQQHDRFRAELIRAQDVGIRLIILVEFKWNAPRCLEDVRRWDNPRLRTSPKAITGERLYKVLATLRNRYDVGFAFCLESKTGQTIVDILQRGGSDDKR